MEVEATYTNWFLGFGTSDGVRITFGESFSKDESFVVGHLAVQMPLKTAVQLHNMLGSVIKSLIEVKQRELQDNVAKVLAAGAPADGVIPNNKQN
jgi:hypothetical protein